MILVNELMENIQRHPPAVPARKLLVEHYIACGWLDAAKDDLETLKLHAPRDPDVASLAAILDKKPELPPPDDSPRTSRIKPSSVQKTVKRHVQHKTAQPLPKLDGNLDSARKELADGYSALRSKAAFILTDLLHLRSLQQKVNFPQSKYTPRIQAIVNGKRSDTVTRAGPPGSARGVARAIQASPEKALELSIADLEDTVHWVRAPNGQSSGASDDVVRDALVKRVHALESALPDELKIHSELALMHIVHENLEKSYANDETMLGDLVKDIPRENFYVTEDNYAWDMDELVQAITANGGVMRNPLSKQMFTPKDVRGILMHPQGKTLAALQVQQHEMSKGVRPETISHLEKLGKVLLDDQSSDQLPSRHAIDEFLAYLATCKSTSPACLLCRLIKSQYLSSNKKQSTDYDVLPKIHTRGNHTTLPSEKLCAMQRVTASASTKRVTFSSRQPSTCARIVVPHQMISAR